MKKVKFTLGLMLSMLLFGANVINGQQTDATQVYVNLTISPSTSYANNDAISFYSIHTHDTVNIIFPYDIPGSTSLDIRQDVFDYSEENAPVPSINKNTLSGYANIGDTYNHVFEIKLAFENGKEVIPFLKRRVWTGYALIEDLLLPYEITDKTEFSDGSGTAIYKYTSEIVPLCTNIMNADSACYIDYELWTNNHIGDQPGNGNAYPVVNRTVTIDAADGITIAPEKDIYYVAAYQDYTFEVYGREGEELDITTNSPHYAINKGIKIVATSERTWSVTLSRVFTNLELFIDYKSSTESGEGGENGESGNATVEKDAIWAAGGTLYVKTGTPGILSIYTITGQLYKQEAISDSYTLSMPKGIYIVQLNGKAYKVVL